jgi:hypothetical protein
MSAMPARVTELSESPAVVASPVRAPTPPSVAAPAATPAARRVDRRAMLKLARRSRQRWALLGGAILAVSFVLTVGILDVLR